MPDAKNNHTKTEPKISSERPMGDGGGERRWQSDVYKMRRTVKSDCGEANEDVSKETAMRNGKSDW